MEVCLVYLIYEEKEKIDTKLRERNGINKAKDRRSKNLYTP